MNKILKNSVTEAQLDQASDWYARLKSDNLSDQDRIAFSKWLSDNEQHQNAYAKIEGMWEDLSVVSQLHFEVSPEENHSPEQKPTASNKHQDNTGSPGHTSTKPAWAFFAMPIALMVAISLWLNVFSNSFQTQSGEQRTIFLDDGSIVYLNTNSALSVNLNETQRLLTLKYGEAYFDVAHDSSRPFIVEAGDISVKAVGTAFDIYYQCNSSKDTLVTVVEGKVRVSSDTNKQQNDSGGQLLKASEQTHISNNTIRSVQSVNPKFFTSWKDQQLIYDGTSLEKVVNDINRYTKDEIKIADDQLRTIPVSAVFKIQDQKTIIKTLEETFNLKAIRVSDSVILLDKIRT